MFFRFAIFMILLASLGPIQGKAQDKAQDKAQKKGSSEAKAASRKSEPEEPARVVYTPTAKPKLPDGAVEVEPGLWKHVDKDNRTWFYRRTPFGVAKFEASQTPAGADDESDGVIARETGDSVEFQRKTPFGTSKWTRKKGELNASERAALERSKKAVSKE